MGNSEVPVDKTAETLERLEGIQGTALVVDGYAGDVQRVVEEDKKPQEGGTVFRDWAAI